MSWEFMIWISDTTPDPAEMIVSEIYKKADVDDDRLGSKKCRTS